MPVRRVLCPATCDNQPFFVFLFSNYKRSCYVIVLSSIRFTVETYVIISIVTFVQPHQILLSLSLRRRRRRPTIILNVKSFLVCHLM